MHAKLTGRWRGLAAVPMDNGTRTQYPQTTATPGPSKFRMQFPHDTNRCTLKNRKISTIRFQYLKYAQGNCMRNSEMQSGLSTMPRPAHRHGGRRRVRRAWLRCPWAVAGPGRTTSRRAERSSRRGRLAGGPPPTGTQSSPAPPVWRAPEGPEGKGGLRGAAPNEVRSPSLAGGRALRRPQHPWGHKQPGPAREARRSSPSEPCARAGASRPGRSGCGPRCAAPRLRCR